MKCLTWNLEWASPTSKRLGIIRERIIKEDLDVACYTEVIRSTLPEDGFIIEASPDYGYRNTGEKRKVVLWSKYPWTEIDDVGDPTLPSGRYISGVTRGIRFIGVCIPWRDAHVRTGRKDRKPWEDHLSYCRGLGAVLERFSHSSIPICMLGDYNQRIPRGSQPEHVFEALLASIPKHFRVATQGMKDADGKSLIDHFAVSSDLNIEVKDIVARFSHDGTKLSDHVGVLVNLTKNKASNTLAGNTH